MGNAVPAGAQDATSNAAGPPPLLPLQHRAGPDTARGQDSGPSGAEALSEYVRSSGGARPLSKILIASNGMAATKAIMSLRQWAYMESGLDNVFTFVAMATREDLDANAEFIRLADSYVEVPAGKNVNNYGNVDVICRVAVEQKVDAVWPGWGHASENPRLPAKLAELGIVFVGPSSRVMAALGDKIAAGILAQTAGVPSIPWSGDGLKADLTSDGEIPQDIFRRATLHSLEEALACAERIGYPVVLKASEGGGGKGIRMSACKADLELHYPQVQAEVPGSPVFMMQLCRGARHIEVQIIGDMHGNVVALNGRDCSTQRRFQKIFEEGPPVIVPRDKFKEMERAAQRLTRNIGYVGAGTIEYLYNAQTNKFFFLELNPRLQVEHPVTEAITQVNIPATQMQVAMGIPLHRMPQIRRFYGKASNDRDSPINFMEDEYVYPTVHCMAARITAENPDDGFKPTSGKIERIKFQSSVSCWGYFSVWTHAGVHEFADSQFGHLFARGADREEARKTLMLALKNLEIVGEIRNPVEYLVELLGSSKFVRNDIDTSWLDGIIQAKAVRRKYDAHDVVFYAAVFRAVRAARRRDAEMADAVAKRRLGLLGQAKGLQHFQVEIAFEGSRYSFRVQRAGADLFVMCIGEARMVAQVRVQPDDSLLVAVGDSVMKVFGTEDALGLRLRLQGIGTIVLPTLYDPTELRSEFNGKVIRYLQADGSSVRKGDPYVELEAMKMVMPLRAGASGKVAHLKSPGGLVQAGELLARLELEDPSSAQPILAFEGPFRLRAGTGAGGTQAPCPLRDPLDRAMLAMDGYAPLAAAAALAGDLFGPLPDESGDAADEAGRCAAAAAGALLDRYLEVEGKFAARAGESEDLACAALLEECKDDPQGVVAILRAKSQMSTRNEVVLATLKAIGGLQARAKGEESPLRILADRIQALAALPSEGGHGEVLATARQLAETLGLKTLDQRRAALREAVATHPSDGVGRISTWEASKAGAELLVSLLRDNDTAVRTRALELLIRRTYRAFGVSTDSKIHVADHGPGRLSARWRFRHPGVSCEGATQSWNGCCITSPDVAALGALLKQGQLPFGADGSSAGCQRGRLHLILGSLVPIEKVVEPITDMLKAADSQLRKAKISEAVLFLPTSGNHLAYATFTEGLRWCEAAVRRNISPTAFSLLEVNCLAEEYDLQQIAPIPEWASHIFFGAKKGTDAKARNRLQTIFARAISHARLSPQEPSGPWATQLASLLLSTLYELEGACLDSRIAGNHADSRVFLHLTSLVDIDAPALSALLESFMRRFVSRHGARLQKAFVDEIVVKMRLGRDGCQATLRFTTSSMAGEYMKSVALLEKVHPECGTPATHFFVASGEERSPADNQVEWLAAKRLTARRAGSTYAPEFLGMLEAALVRQWSAYGKQQGGGTMPASLFKSVELVLGPDGLLQERERGPGLNDIGMIAWKCTLRTPEYRDGRTIVLIANDVTHQAGSFGVEEDIFFQKVTQYARAHGVPRIHFSCNSGARLGLVEELMPKIRIRWNDPADPEKGFQYLYLAEADFAGLPRGAVVARQERPAPECGIQEPHWALEAVVGEGLPSTFGGIGVENLSGSGLIAGETSRAYNDIFTLSYVTGRSVGIGAYLNRLGQRTIQAASGPLILTGYSALNKLLGREVYTSQEQLGGPQVMVPNGVTHQLVQNDQEGAEAIVDWLSYVPRDTWSLPPMIPAADPPSRRVAFRPSKQPYDPRHMLAGVSTDAGFVPGFFDAGSFREYLAGWGRSVVIGRARLGGVPMGVIAVETRNVERRIPADPGNSESREVLEPQAGQVWFPDSAYKTATAIRDFNRGENLPLMIFANWRGFSGGTRDMFGEVIKFGAQIVDALVEYKHPVFIYIPPGGELRGGSWVVIDPQINPSVMEMYADVESRGGILEPAGVVEVKFRRQQRVQLMHRSDARLQALKSELEAAAGSSSASAIKASIAKREEQLEALYTQVACEFADLHDRSGRMKSTGVIREGLEWATSREFFYWRVRRRLLEQRAVRDILAADPSLVAADAQAMLEDWMPVTGDREVVEYLQYESVADKVRALRGAALHRQIAALQAELGGAPAGAAADAVDASGKKGLFSCFRRPAVAEPARLGAAGGPPPEARRAAYPGLLGAERGAGGAEVKKAAQGRGLSTPSAAATRPQVL